MSLIDCSVQSYSFMVGSFDATAYLDSLVISVPNSEWEKPLIWSGSFNLSYNLKAIQNGLSKSDFSHFSSPTRWREGLQVVTITINGYTLPKMRIQDYKFNDRSVDNNPPQGQGTLTQVLELMTFDRQGQDIPGTDFNPGISLTSVIYGLVVTASNINGNQIVPTSQISIPNVTGTVDVKLTSQNPIDDAQKFAATNAMFLWTDNTEVISLIKRPDIATPVFQRALSETRIYDPNTENINFAADHVIATGSRQTAKTPDPSPTAQPTDEYDKQGRERMQRTEIKKPLGDVFPDNYPGSEVEITTGYKTVFYRYQDMPGTLFNPDIYPNLTQTVTDACNTYPATLSTNYAGLNGVVQTITVEETILGEVLKLNLPAPETVSGLPTAPQVTSATIRFTPDPINAPAIDPRYLTFVVNSLSVETESRRVTFIPFGRKYPDVDVSFDRQVRLTIDQDENLKTQLLTSVTIQSLVNPKTGQAAQIEPQPTLESRNVATDYNYETTPIKGEYELTPNGWNNFLPRTYEIAFQYLSDQSQANELARLTAIREMARRDAVNITIPIPKEWLANYCKPFQVCDIYTGRFLIENPQIFLNIKRDVKNGNVETQDCYFSFIGEYLGSISEIASPPTFPTYIPIGSQFISINPFQIDATKGTAFSYTVIPIGGTPGYTFSASGLPAGLSINSLTGVISGTPT